MMPPVGPTKDCGDLAGRSAVDTQTQVDDNDDETPFDVRASSKTVRATNLSPRRSPVGQQNGHASLNDIFDGQGDPQPDFGRILPPRPTSTQHERQVSWDQQLVVEHAIPSSPSAIKSIYQPNLYDSDPSPLAMEDISEGGTQVADDATTVRPVKDCEPNMTFKFALEDIVQQTPYEAEAETYILKALEQRDPTAPQTRPRSDTNTSTIMSNVPDDYSQSLTNSHEEVDRHGERSLQASDTYAASDANSDLTSTHLNSSARDKQAEKALRERKHRRDRTMEETLFGLTSALDAMQSLESTPMAAVAWTVPEIDKGGLAGSSADQLAVNASLLFQRKKNDAVTPDDNASVGGSSVESGRSGKSRWDLLRANVDSILKHSERGSVDEIPVVLEVSEEEDADGSASDVESPAVDDPQEKTTKKSRFPFADKIKEEWEFASKFHYYFGTPLSRSIYWYCKVALLYLILPSTGIAAILYYLAENPATDRDSVMASVSWWFLFIGVRQVVTFSLALGTQLILIDFLSIRVGGTLRVLGPWGSLGLVQAKGWPFILFAWGLFDFAILYGDGPFYNHWLFWQGTIDMCTSKNPAGQVVNSDAYRRILSVAVSLGAVAAVKRFWLALFLGRQTFSQHADNLAAVMKRVLLVTQVAALAREFERHSKTRLSSGAVRSSMVAPAVLESFVHNMEEIDDVSDNPSLQFTQPSAAGYSADRDEYLIDPDARDPLTGGLTTTQRMKIAQALGRWEEPLIADAYQHRISVGALLQFRRAMKSMNTPFPFSGAFGWADTRENTIESSQEVYERLQLRTPDDDVLTFETIAMVAVRRDGTLDESKLKELVRLFRPNRDGTLRMVDFIKSVDIVYKSVRLLRASVANASKIDGKFEDIINILFYTVCVCVILSRLGFDPLALFLSVSGVILAFAFAIGSASSKYFEGLLFILVRRPYSIGDGIHVSNVESDTNFGGSAPWLVEDVTLFTTTVVNVWTNERATLSNGSLASSRIINAARSPQAYLYVYLKFSVDVPYSKLQIFRTALEQFVKDRPREWLSMLGFRATTVEAQEGYIEYIVVLQHRESWQQVTPLYMSKAAVSSFALELAKQMDMRYVSPPMPILLQQQQVPQASSTTGSVTGPNLSDRATPVAGLHPDMRSVSAMFEKR